MSRLGTQKNFDHYVKEGIAFSTAEDWSSVPDSENREILITLGSGKYLGIEIQLEADGQSSLYLFEQPSVSDNGTELSIFNRNRRSSKSSAVSAYHTPTISDDGTQLSSCLLSGSKKGKDTLGLKTMERGSWILKEGYSYLIRATNNAGSDIDLLIKAVWHEEHV